MKRREENGNDDSDEEIGFDSPTAEFPEQELVIYLYEYYNISRVTLLDLLE